MQAVTLEPLPVPAEFPVEWPDPADERYLWNQDRMHFPVSLTRADADLLAIFLGHGFSHAFEIFSVPARMKTRLINTYEYQSVQPISDDPLVLQQMEREAEGKLGAAMAALQSRWEGEQLPDVLSALARWQAFDLQAASTPELIAHLDAALAAFQRMSEIHFEVVLPSYLAMSLFDDYYQDLFGGEDAFASYRLLQGLPNKTVESGLELWKLSRVALATPEVCDAFRAGSAAGILAALEQSEVGRAFRASLDEYLETYGQRGGQLSFAPASWIEDPTPAIELLKEYLQRPDVDLEAELAAQAREREASVAAARDQIAAYPAPVREQFEFLLAAAQTGTVLSEDHNFYIDFAAVYQLRRILLEFGRRLAAGGAIAEAADVVHLSFAEMGAALRGEPGRWEKLIAWRKAEIEHYSKIEPPASLGTPPAAAPPDNPMNRTMAKFLGLPPGPQAEPNLLAGSPGSSGVAWGRVKIVRSLEEASMLTPGDVLVAATTDSAWTPLFATVAAIVTDTGGVLSHGAVVAREYGLPAVVGTGTATRVLRDGQLVEVDGAAGVVRIIDAG